MEIIAVRDAMLSVSVRLQVDFNGGTDSSSGFETWNIGGLVWRERVKWEDEARRYPELAWRALP